MKKCAKSIEKDFKCLDAARGTLLGTGQILQGLDSLFAAEVDDQQVGSLSRDIR